METPTIGAGEVLAIFIVGIIWLAFATIPAFNAKRKGYNFWLAYVGSLAFFVPMLLVVAVLPNKGEGSSKNMERLGHNICTLCGRESSASATSCANCGMAFATATGNVTPVESMNLSAQVRADVNEGRTRICQNCGRLNNPNRTSCKSCGTELAV